ncbi:hypothetical protein AB4X15_03305 [Peribacillus simplex]|uniref:hypothetical protein n=1 Tax=Peribacillus TaxID=2675229 RepID=UPI0032E3A4B0
MEQWDNAPGWMGIKVESKAKINASITTQAGGRSVSLHPSHSPSGNHLFLF